jgi:hypothetical protein
MRRPRPGEQARVGEHGDAFAEALRCAAVRSRASSSVGRLIADNKDQLAANTARLVDRAALRKQHEVSALRPCVRRARRAIIRPRSLAAARELERRFCRLLAFHLTRELKLIRQPHYAHEGVPQPAAGTSVKLRPAM